ncbi:MAG: LysM peptidoglycan-binding domain-containing protein [Betaproteobacteria bacterium]|nr:LysM peptidoglycan-binding domain-containing protein [Betaproteobacteria bacterium]
MSRLLQRGMLLMWAIALTAASGCVSKKPAPVVERAAPVKAPAQASSSVRSMDYHTVKRGDTLYSIALEHGQAYRDVAAWNNIDNPNMIRVGQQLRVAPPEGVAVARPIDTPAAVETRPLAAARVEPNTDMVKREPRGGKQPFTEQALASAQREEPARKEPPPAASPRPEPWPAEPAAAGGEFNWTWPSQGRLIGQFVEGGNKGIDIEGKIGDAVVAAEAGKVTYAGSGIRGYGNLLIIQHPNGLSSVYAHNDRLIAKEGQQVVRGQKIAELGNSDADQPRLHFEIRRQGKPIDPLKLLPVR